MGKLLNFCRNLLWGAVIGAILLMIGNLIMGVGRVVSGFGKHFTALDFSAKAGKTVAIKTIEVIDIFLVATVAYITAVGLYKLFINKEFQLPSSMKINKLHDLENKIIGVIVAALAVSFLGLVGSDEPADIMNIGIGIAVVIVSLGFYVKWTSNKNKHTSADPDQKREE